MTGAQSSYKNVIIDDFRMNTVFEVDFKTVLLPKFAPLCLSRQSRFLHNRQMKKLSDLKPGDIARVIGIQSSELKPKLLEMGLVENQEIKVLFKAPFGDPIAVEVGDYVLSMRKDEAILVNVE